MSSETSMVAANFRLQEWAAQIRECQSQEENPVQQVVPVEPGLLQQDHKAGSMQPELHISAKGFSVYVTESTPMPLLAAVLEVIQHAE